jgi:sorting nexin-29
MNFASLTPYRTKSKGNTNLATFNVRGLTEESKKIQLIEDVRKYNIQVCSLQETKIREDTDEQRGGCRLITFNTDQPAYGNGFVVGPKWKNSIQRFWKVSDRIAVIQFNMEPAKYKVEEVENLKMKLTRIDEPPKRILTIVNVYAPHTGRLREDLSELTEMYEQLDLLLAEWGKSKHLVFITGDFNAKVGRLDTPCLGNYGRGRTNVSGMSLIEFCEAHGMFVTNTAFRHSARHITTWESTRTMHDRTIRIFNQIDYIICSQKIKHTLTNARSYGGTLTTSDHRMVVSSFDLRLYRLFPQHKNKVKFDRIVPSRLANDHTREEYQKEIDDRLANLEPNCTWEEIVNIVNEAAKEVLAGGTSRCGNEGIEIAELSAKQKDLRLRIANTQDKTKAREMKQNRNQILKKIRQEVRKREEDRLDELALEIEQANQTQRMFRSVKMLRQKKQNPLVVTDSQGRKTTNPREVHKQIFEFYKNKFQDPNARGICPEEEPKSLEDPITISEVKKCLQSMKNGKAPGADKICAEFLKYGSNNLHNHICRILNEIFEKQIDANIGKGIIVPLQKPGKPTGVLKNLRPVTLLTTLRKTLSLITIGRIKKATEEFVAPSQSAYRTGRSTTDIVWTHKWNIAKAMKFQTESHVTGIDMTAAFDTIDRQKMTDIYKSFLNTDQQRMIRTLMTKTTLEIKIPEHENHRSFESNVGSPQGDGISGMHFDVYLEVALSDAREMINEFPENKQRQEHDYSLKEPNEAEYADDVDFISPTEEEQQFIAENIAKCLAKHNLTVNNEKTELTTIKRGQRHEETWRKSKKLGSLLGDEEDIIRRKNLATAALGQLKHVWKRANLIRLAKRLQLYNTLVKSILLYNSETWGLSKTREQQLNSFHRQQLRKVLGVNYKDRLPNLAVYNRCEAEEISLQILTRRWSFFGHVLRLPENTPSWLAMKHFFNNQHLRKFKGRPRITIVTTLQRDINRLEKRNPVYFRNKRVPHLNSTEDLSKLRHLALNKPFWKNLTNCIYTAAKAEA